jgi:pSer/pThr/pTyr-binding forkhead associated (FHA) protein
MATPQDLKDRIAAERRGTPFLVYRDVDDRQVIVDLQPTGERVAIGRRPSNDVVLDWDSEISRVHAALERIGDEWTVVDDGLSHNGTYLNGSRVTSRQRLHDGDVLTVGGVAIAYRATGSGESVSRPTVTALGPHVGELLTPAQRRVLVALCRPFKDATYATPASNQQIADELFVGVDALPQNQKRASLALQALRTGVITRRDL